MAKLHHIIFFLAQNVYGSLFKASFYRKAIDYKLKFVLLSFFTILFLAYSVPLSKIYLKIFSIDLVNPNNQISNEIDSFIQQVPKFSISEGKFDVETKEVIEIRNYNKDEVIVVFNQAKSAKPESAIFFADNGVYLEEEQIKDYVINLFDLPENNKLFGDLKENYSFVSYEQFNDIDVSSVVLRDFVTSLIAEYDLKYLFLISFYFVFANFLVLIAQITIFSFLTLTILGRYKIKYKNIFTITSVAFIPFLLLEIINIITFKQSFILNSYPYSFVVFIAVNTYFVRFAANSIVKIKK
ncbi:MAG: DUF1189 family protein [Rickettsiales bacterium]|nr:DUF1189 family protein [Rickettsiales bacterium]